MILGDTAIAIQRRPQVEVDVAGLHFERDAAAAIAVEYQPAVSEDAMHEVWRSPIEHDQVDRTLQELDEILLQGRRHLGQGSWSTRSEQDRHIDVTHRLFLVSRDTAEQVRRVAAVWLLTKVGSKSTFDGSARRSDMLDHDRRSVPHAVRPPTAPRLFPSRRRGGWAIVRRWLAFRSGDLRRGSSCLRVSSHSRVVARPAPTAAEGPLQRREGPHPEARRARAEARPAAVAVRREAPRAAALRVAVQRAAAATLAPRPSAGFRSTERSPWVQTTAGASWRSSTTSSRRRGTPSTPGRRARVSSLAHVR